MQKNVNTLNNRKKYWLISLAILVLASMPLSCKQNARDKSDFGLLKDNYAKKAKRYQITDSLLVKFKSGVTASTKKKALEVQGLKIRHKIKALAVYETKVDKNKLSNKIAQLKKNPNVEYVEPNFKRSALFFPLVTPNDTYYSLQYGLPRIQASRAWDIERGSTSAVKIAIVDTGVELTHPDLTAKISPGYDFVNNDDVANDDHGHGSHVAGIASAVSNNGLGVAGLSWGAQIMPVKVLDADGGGTDEDVSEGIIWAADNGAKVINLSLGGYEYSQTLQNATNYAYNRGVIVLAAAGNDGDGSVLYPAGNANVVGVAATNRRDQRASFSNHNSTVDVSAPGVNIASTYIDYQYAYMSGTSMSTPFASGLSALIYSKNAGISAGSVSNILKLSSKDLGRQGRDNFFGWGRIDAYYAVSGNPAISKFNVTGSRGRKVLDAWVRDSHGIANVQFRLDGRLKAVDRSSPYHKAVSTRRLRNGYHRFTVTAVDRRGKKTIVTKRVRVINRRK